MDVSSINAEIERKMEEIRRVISDEVMGRMSGNEKELLHLALQLKNKHIIDDRRLYDMLVQNEFAVFGERYTDDLTVAKKISAIRNSTLKTIDPSDQFKVLPKDQQYALLANKRNSKALNRAREKIAEELRRKVKKTEEEMNKR